MNVLSAIVHPMRLRVLDLLAEGERPACELVYGFPVFMLNLMPYVYAQTQEYLKGYKLPPGDIIYN